MTTATLKRTGAVLIALAMVAAPAAARAQMSNTRAGLPSDTSRIKRGSPADTGAARRGLLGQPVAVKANTSPEDDRALSARLEKRFEVKRLFRERGLEFPAAETFFRIFKRERVLEVWVRPQGKDQFALLKEYPICALAGQLGPKRTQGDGQTPEGFYSIDSFNPTSGYYLSLHINYPNRADQLSNQGRALGGAIFIHGGCQTEGCLAVTDEAIKELWVLASESRAAGQTQIPVHIFPARLTDAELKRLTQAFDKKPELKQFWASLKPSYDYFERTRLLPQISIDERGKYRMAPFSLIGKPTAIK